MNNAIIERVGLLLEQNNIDAAEKVLNSFLNDHPDHFIGRYYKAVILLQKDDKETARIMCQQLLSEEPDSYAVLSLAINVDLADDKDKPAEEKAELLLSIYSEDSDAHALMSRVKLNQNNYDAALVSADRALELDAENEDAYSLKIMIGGLLGKSDTNSAIEDALNLNPENPSLIANQGYQLVREGKIDEALERLQYALSIDPNNDMARFAMMEALKARFWPYRMFHKYAEWQTKLSEQGSWTFIIGAYIAYRFLNRMANENPDLEPYLMPIVYFILFLFIFSWVITPLSNLYLLTNPYGRILLDKDDKLMAQLVGSALGLSILFGAASWAQDSESLLNCAFVSFGSMIPLGTFLTPVSDKNRLITKLFSIGIPALGFIGISTGQMLFFYGALMGLFAYQWVINGIIIRENSRQF